MRAVAGLRKPSRPETDPGPIRGASLGGSFVPLHLAKRVWERAVELRNDNYAGDYLPALTECSGLTARQILLVLITFGLEAERAEAAWRVAMDSARSMAREARSAVWREAAA